MREGLRPLAGRVLPFQATVSRSSLRRDRDGFPYLELGQVHYEGREVAEHLWIFTNAQIQALHLEEGEQIAFQALVSLYVRQNPRIGVPRLDFKLDLVDDVKRRP